MGFASPQRRSSYIMQNTLDLRQQVDPDLLDLISSSSSFSLPSKKLEDLDIISLRMLLVAAETPGIKAKEYEAKLHLSKAPISVRAKNLTEDKFIIRSIAPGTEHLSKPTYCYLVNPDVDLQRVKELIRKQTSGKANADKSSNKAPAPMLPEQPRLQSEQATNQASEPTTIEVLIDALKEAFREIDELKTRLARVEQSVHSDSAQELQQLLSSRKS